MSGRPACPCRSRASPLQGHSGIKVMPDGSFWVITDNGMGSRYNSADSMLYLNRHKIDWTSGKIDRQETVFLHDPDKKVPFRIVHEDTAKRYLTGADFDTEGFQVIGDTFWIGDEFGPYVIKADKSGKVLAVFETIADGKPVRSPDHWSVQSPGAPGASYTTVNLRRSKGYEGFASSKDGKFLYGLLEGPLWDSEKKDWEKVDGKEASRILEFDVAAEKFTGRYWQYVFEQNGNAIGDFNMIDASSGLIIERDNGEGTADKACAQGTRGENCFPDLAKFKRVYKIDLSEANVGKPVRKIGFIDLMKIRDPDKKARKPLNDGRAGVSLFHHRERRPRRRDAYHCRQRQQPAVLVKPRSQQGRRQRVRAAGGRGVSEGEVNRHCERSEAIHLASRRKTGLLRRSVPRNDGTGVQNTFARRATAGPIVCRG